MKELIPSRSNYDLADLSGHKGIDTIFWRATSQYKKKKLAETSKTGLKLHPKLLLVPSPERTGYRKSYLAGLLMGQVQWPQTLTSHEQCPLCYIRFHHYSIIASSIMTILLEHGADPTVQGSYCSVTWLSDCYPTTTAGSCLITCPPCPYSSSAGLRLDYLILAGRLQQIAGANQHFSHPPFA